MAAPLKISLENPSFGQELAIAFYAMRLPVAGAATAAVRRAGDQLKVLGRANIASAGFGPRWQNTWRVIFYPNSGESIDCAAWAHHKIPYSAVFEEGIKIAGAPKLWIPLPTTPKIGRAKATAKKMAASGVKLFSVTRPGKLPLLMANIKASKTAATGSRAVSLAKLRGGSKPAKKAVRLQAVPLFYGIDAVQMKKKFQISDLADKQRDLLEVYYDEALKVD